MISISPLAHSSLLNLVSVEAIQGEQPTDSSIYKKTLHTLKNC